MDKRISFTDQIRQAVDECGFSRIEIARRVGVDRAVITRLMNGTAFLSEGTLNALAGVLGLAVIKLKTKKER
jgi:transcriptional regulator with XRE-family HTH domain